MSHYHTKEILLKEKPCSVTLHNLMLVGYGVLHRGPQVLNKNNLSELATGIPFELAFLGFNNGISERQEIRRGCSQFV